MKGEEVITVADDKKDCDKCKNEGIAVRHGDKLPCPQDQKEGKRIGEHEKRPPRPG